MNKSTYRKELRQLEALQDKILKDYRKQVAEVRQGKRSKEEIDSIQHTEEFELRMIRDEIESIQSRYLISQAMRLRVQISLDRSDWEYNECSTGFRYLTQHAYSDLRKAIRQELLDRSQLMQIKLQLITSTIAACTGLAGVIIGLVAVITK